MELSALSTDAEEKDGRLLFEQRRQSGAVVRRLFASGACAMLCASAAVAQEQEKEPVAIAEIGAAGEWAAKGHGSSYGPSLAVETTPIEGWLEIEGGVTPLFSRGRTEWDVDLLFKKPFTLSSKAEFMVGIGPSWSHDVSRGHSEDIFGAEAALDFMFWPWKGRKIGWFIEPSYGRSFNADHEQALSASVGLLIPIGRKK